jgi:hypothetical protein
MGYFDKNTPVKLMQTLHGFVSVSFVNDRFEIGFGMGKSYVIEQISAKIGEIQGVDTVFGYPKLASETIVGYGFSKFCDALVTSNLIDMIDGITYGTFLVPSNSAID